MIKLYHKIKDFDATTINPNKETLALACCDCGYVHHIKLELIEDNKIVIAFRSDKRATAQLRRYQYGDLQQGLNKMYGLERVREV